MGDPAVGWARGIAEFTGVPIMRYSRVTPQIYVGPQFNKLGKRGLERAGISAVVNLRVRSSTTRPTGWRWANNIATCPLWTTTRPPLRTSRKV